MTDTKMLQAILDGQRAIKEELKDDINSVRKEVNRLHKKADEGFRIVNNRLDNIGKSVAFLEDDAPTREEHNRLEKRVIKIENKLQT